MLDAVYVHVSGFPQDDGEQLRLTEIGALLQTKLGGVWTERSVKLALAREGYVKILSNIQPSPEDENLALNFELLCQSFGVDQYIFVGEVASVSESGNSMINRGILGMPYSVPACISYLQYKYSFHESIIWTDCSSRPTLSKHTMAWQNARRASIVASPESDVCLRLLSSKCLSHHIEHLNTVTAFRLINHASPLITHFENEVQS